MRCIRSNFLSWCKYTFSCDPKCVLKAKGNKVSKVQKVHVQVYYIQVDFNSLSKFSSIDWFSKLLSNISVFRIKQSQNLTCLFLLTGLRVEWMGTEGFRSACLSLVFITLLSAKSRWICIKRSIGSTTFQTNSFHSMLLLKIHDSIINRKLPQHFSHV